MQKKKIKIKSHKVLMQVHSDTFAYKEVKAIS